MCGFCLFGDWPSDSMTSVMITDAWTVNFEIRLEVQLRTYQPPIPKPSQASAWSYRYSGRWMCKPKVPLVDYNRISASSPIRLGRDFGRLNSW